MKLTPNSSEKRRPGVARPGSPVREVTPAEYLAFQNSRRSVRRIEWLDPNLLGLVDRDNGEIVLTSFRSLYGERAWPQCGLLRPFPVPPEGESKWSTH